MPHPTSDDAHPGHAAPVRCDTLADAVAHLVDVTTRNLLPAWESEDHQPDEDREPDEDPRTP